MTLIYGSSLTLAATNKWIIKKQLRKPLHLHLFNYCLYLRVPPPKGQNFRRKVGRGELSVPFQKLHFVRKLGWTLRYFWKIDLSIKNVYVYTV